MEPSRNGLKRVMKSLSQKDTGDTAIKLKDQNEQ